MRRMSVVGVGGTLRSGSSTESVVRSVLGHLETLGADTRLFSGEALDLPLYRPGIGICEKADRLIAALRSADAVVLGSPAYHGGISGLVKNAIDYLEETARDERPYLTGLPIGCIGTGFGWQGSNSALVSLRSIAHALRGWPTPLGIAVNSKTPVFDEHLRCVVPELDIQMRLMAEQISSLGNACQAR